MLTSQAYRTAALALLFAPMILTACGSRSGLQAELYDDPDAADAGSDAAALDTASDSGTEDTGSVADTATDVESDTDTPDTRDDADVGVSTFVPVEARPPVGAGITALRSTDHGLYAATQTGLWRLDAFDSWWTRLGTLPNPGDRLYVYGDTIWIHRFGASAYFTDDPDGEWTQMDVSEQGCLAAGDDTLYNVSGGERVAGGIEGPVTRRWDPDTSTWESILTDTSFCVEAGGESAGVVGDRLVRVRAGGEPGVWTADEAWEPLDSVPDELRRGFPIIIRPAVVDADTLWITTDGFEPFSLAVFRSRDGRAWDVLDRPDTEGILDMHTSVVPFEGGTWIATAGRDTPVFALEGDRWEVVDTEDLGGGTADRELAFWSGLVYLADDQGISAHLGSSWTTMGYGLYEPDPVAASDALYVRRGQRLYYLDVDGRWDHTVLDGRITESHVAATGRFVVVHERQSSIWVHVSSDGGATFERVSLADGVPAERPRLQGIDAEHALVEADDVLWAVPLDASAPFALSTGLPLERYTYRVGAGAYLAKDSEGAMFMLTDLGGTWSPMALELTPERYVTRLVNHGEAVWAMTQASSGPVYRSEDQGATWDEVEAIHGASHLVSWGDTLVAAVPGAGGTDLYRLDDDTWEVFGRSDDAVANVVATPTRLTVVTATTGWLAWER